MTTGAAEGSQRDVSPELRLAEAWADFTKALSIYPDTNARVRTRMQAMREALEECLAGEAARPGHDAERGVTLLFHGHELVCGKEQHPMAQGSALAWMAQRLAHAGLAGVEWMPGLENEPLLAFTHRLLSNYLRKEPDVSFESFWPETYEGVVLVDRRFEGTFGGRGPEGPYAGGHAGTSIEEAETRNFVLGVLRHPKVARRVARLQEAGGAKDDEAASLRATDLLRRIMEDVPAEALESREALIASVCAVLDRLGEAAPGRPAPHRRPEGRAFAALLQRASLTHFARKGPGLERLKVDAREHLDPSPAGGRARDDEISDDVAALVREVRGLPSTLAYDLRRGDADSQAEQVAALLHYLVHLEHPEDLRGLHPALGRLLVRPDAASLAVLREHLRQELTEGGADAQGRVLPFLVRGGRASLLRECGVLTPEFVREDVAQRLPIYLAALDPHDNACLAELDELCARLGTRIFESEAPLQVHLAELRREQAAGFFRRPHPARLALLRILLACHPGRLVPETASFLRSLDLPEDEAFLLFQLKDPSHLSPGYLGALIDLHLGRGRVDEVRAAVVAVLCHHIRSTRDPLPAAPERLASIRSLARYPSPAGAYLLQEMSKTWFGPFGGTEPRAVRKLARSVAREIREGGHGAPPPDTRHAGRTRAA
jgi:hypothetical protein